MCTTAVWAKRFIQGDERGYFADRAYDKLLKARRSNGAARSGRNRLEDQARPLPARAPGKASHRLDWERALGVERAFATMKRWYGMGRVRYLGLARNACHLQFVAMAMNMKRALVLIREA